ncbi:hypothetical protein EJB05_24103, partial [Eragrostis curvula]
MTSYLVMVAKKCTFDSGERFWIAISIAEGLNYLHSLGIVHGDVRTANVLELLCILPGQNTHERIKAEKNSGYVDPRFLESEILTKGGDVYSLGIILLELFTGEMASNHTRNCQLEELCDKEVCRHIAGTRRMVFKCLDANIRKRPTLEEAIRLFTKEMDGL